MEYKDFIYGFVSRRSHGGEKYGICYQNNFIEFPAEPMTEVDAIIHAQKENERLRQLHKDKALTDNGSIFTWNEVHVVDIYDKKDTIHSESTVGTLRLGAVDREKPLNILTDSKIKDHVLYGGWSHEQARAYEHKVRNSAKKIDEPGLCHKPTEKCNKKSEDIKYTPTDKDTTELRLLKRIESLEKTIAKIITIMPTTNKQMFDELKYKLNTGDLFYK